MSHGDCEGQTTNTFDLILVLLLILLMIIIDTDKGPSSMVKRTKHARVVMLFTVWAAQSCLPPARIDHTIWKLNDSAFLVYRLFRLKIELYHTFGDLSESSRSGHLSACFWSLALTILGGGMDLRMMVLLKNK